LHLFLGLPVLHRFHPILCAILCASGGPAGGAEGLSGAFGLGGILFRSQGERKNRPAPAASTPSSGPTPSRSRAPLPHRASPPPIPARPAPCCPRTTAGISRSRGRKASRG